MAQPRPKNSTETKARILLAACESFAEMGYAKAGLREIAGRAGVAPSLLLRYFGTKSALFEASLVKTIESNSVFTWEKEGFGEKMVLLMQQESNISITAMLILAMADPESSIVAERITRSRITGPLADWLGPPEAHARATTLVALLTGFTIQEQTSGLPQPTAKWLAQALQSIVDNRSGII